MTFKTKQWMSDALYKQILQHVPVATVDIVFFNRNKDAVLLGRRSRKPLVGQYYTIGGRMLKGESFENAALRQAKRELGLTIQKKNLHFAGAVSERFRDSIYPGVRAHTVNIYFAYRLRGTEQVTLDGQHSSYAWVPITQKNLHPFVREKIKGSAVVL